MKNNEIKKELKYHSSFFVDMNENGLFLPLAGHRYCDSS